MSEPVLRPGMQHSRVRRAKWLLRRQLRHMGKSRKGIGRSVYYGNAAAHGIRLIQARHGLTVDGIIGPATWAVLEAEPRVKPAKVLHWRKWTPQRARVRRLARKRGMTLTSGDRVYNSLASKGRISAHWIRFNSQWADDYWHPSLQVMRDFAVEVNARRPSSEPRFAQVLVHDAGSGNHVHVAGVRY